VHPVLEIMGKGGKERLESWLDIAGIRGELGQ
jgi:hypothetical protein